MNTIQIQRASTSIYHELSESLGRAQLPRQCAGALRTVVSGGLAAIVGNWLRLRIEREEESACVEGEGVAEDSIVCWMEGGSAELAGKVSAYHRPSSEHFGRLQLGVDVQPSTNSSLDV